MNQTIVNVNLDVKERTPSRHPETNKTIPSFEIYRLEDAHQKAKLTQPVRSHAFEILWIESGSGCLKVDLEKIDVSDCMIICLAPGQVRTLSSFIDLKGYYISMRSDYVSLIGGISELSFFSSTNFGLSKAISFILDQSLANETNDLMRKMLVEFNDVLSFRSEMLKGLVKVFLISISRSVRLKEELVMIKRDTEMVTRFMDSLKQHYKTLKKVSDYADQLCVTPNYLNQMVKRVSGFPASYHIQQQIVLEAKRQATYTGLRMKEIADSLGFHDYAHFSKFFKSYSGISFSTFKSSLAQ